MVQSDVRLNPGCHLYEGPDGWRLALPGDRFERVAGPDGLLAPFRRLVHHGVYEKNSDPSLDEVSAAFDARGLLSHSAPQDAAGAPSDAPVARVLVVGSNPLADLVKELLSPEASVSDGPLTEAAVHEAQVVVTCAGWLPDAEWREVSAWCASAGVAWQMSYLEGVDVVIGPMFLPGLTASYEDVRARRLAASGIAAELRAHWRYLDSDAPKPGEPWPDRAGVSIVAGVLARDVLAHLAGKPIPGLGHQLVVSPTRCTIERHPVLPLPC